MKITDVTNKAMRYCLVTGNGCSSSCKSTDITLMAHWLGVLCVMYYWMYEKKSTVTVPMGISSNTLMLCMNQSGNVIVMVLKTCTTWPIIVLKIRWDNWNIMQALNFNIECGIQLLSRHGDDE